MTSQLKDYLKLPYKLIITPDEEGYGVAVPELPGCFTHAETWEQISALAKEPSRQFA